MTVDDDCLSIAGQKLTNDNTLASRFTTRESNSSGQFLEPKHVDEIMRGV